MITTIIGTGLIGGSMALDLRARGFTEYIIGIDNNKKHVEQALSLGLVDEVMSIDEAIEKSDLIIVSIPVNETVKILPYILNKIKLKTVVTDMGSTKGNICDTVKNHSKRKQFVASHPIAGTECSGPKAAIRNLFDNKISILCNTEESDKTAVSLVTKMYEILKMKLLFMNAHTHDMHVAYISHISHITSFVLAETVLEIEKNTSTIFELAGSGFESTVRLAKSSADMWTPVFEQNKKFVSEALDVFIKKMISFKENIEQNNNEKIHERINKANEIRRILKEKNN